MNQNRYGHHTWKPPGENATSFFMNGGPKKEEGASGHQNRASVVTNRSAPVPKCGSLEKEGRKGGRKDLVPFGSSSSFHFSRAGQNSDFKGRNDMTAKSNILHRQLVKALIILPKR